jgi:glycosyltransferase involved in cell wall biosynthesis
MILFYIPNFRPGGAERVMINVLNKLFDRGYSVALLVGKRVGPLERLLDSEIPVFELGYDSAKFAWIPLWTFLRKNNPDLLISTLGASVSAALVKSIYKGSFKMISRLGNTIGAEKKLYSNPLKRNLFISLNKMIANASDRIVVQSESMRKDFIEETNTSPQKISLIYNPIDAHLIEKMAEKDTETFDLLAIGRLLPQKDYPMMLSALEILIQSGFKLKLGILGTGELQPELENMIMAKGLEEYVQFLGFQTNPYAFLSRAKLLLSSSRYEGFSNVILESLALGTPVIATDCPGGNAEVIKDGFNGYLCEVGNPKDMAEKIIMALENIENFDKYAIQMETHARFSIEKITDQYIQVMENVLGKPLPLR